MDFLQTLFIHFDMETADPDDVMTLALLATHPRLVLVGVTLTPGGLEQFSLVKHVLKLMGCENVLVGSADPARTKPAVSDFHYNWLGTPPVWQGPVPTANDVIREVVYQNPEVTLLTGAPLKNPGRYPRTGRFFHEWVGQGGFAGDNVVPEEHRLEKFKGRITCPTFNLAGDISAAQNLLTDDRLKRRTLISKNVCHGVAWDRAFHDRVKALPRRTDGLELCLQGMDQYLRKKPEGKLLHDPLAMAYAINRDVCEVTNVHLYRERGEWGSQIPPFTNDLNAWISISVNRERFFETLTAA